LEEGCEVGCLKNDSILSQAFSLIGCVPVQIVGFGDSMDEPRFHPVVQRDAASYREAIGPPSLYNLAAQMIDCLELSPFKVLIVGKGLGMEAELLRFLGKHVVTIDIDPALKPDVVGSVQDLPFVSGSFDVVICAHVLEHLPRVLFESCLAELARVARATILYLPIAGWTVSVKLATKPGAIRINCRIHVPNLRGRHKFDGEHYWEIGKRGSRLTTIRAACKSFFTIRKEYQNPDWLYSYNFVLLSKAVELQSSTSNGPLNVR
jgi:hypothetical protein